MDEIAVLQRVEPRADDLADDVVRAARERVDARLAGAPMQPVSAAQPRRLTAASIAAAAIVLIAVIAGTAIAVSRPDAATTVETGDEAPIDAPPAPDLPPLPDDGLLPLAENQVVASVPIGDHVVDISLEVTSDRYPLPEPVSTDGRSLCVMKTSPSMGGTGGCQRPTPPSDVRYEVGFATPRLDPTELVLSALAPGSATRLVVELEDGRTFHTDAKHHPDLPWISVFAIVLPADVPPAEVTAVNGDGLVVIAQPEIPPEMLDRFHEMFRGETTHTRPDGTTADITAYAGRPAVLVALPPGCPDCRRQLDALEDWWQGSDGRVALVAISMEPDIEVARRMFDDAGVTFDIGFDPNGDVLRGPEPGSWNAVDAGAPVVAVYAASGDGLSVGPGYRTPDQIDQLLDSHR